MTAKEDVDMEAKESKDEKEEAKEETKEEAKEEAKDEDVKEEEEDGDDEEKPPEKPKELEEDAPEDSRPKVSAEKVRINAADTTLNVMPIADGKLLMSLSEGGMQYLLASARATTGIKSGRYAFEARIVEALSPSEPASGERGRTPQPKQLLRVGLSLAGSSIFLADTPDSICFDSEGFFVHGKKRAKCSQKFSRDQTVTMLVNMDSASPNANTVSLFVNGTRVSPPRKIPENLVGQTLFPTVTYRNVSVHVNFGPLQSVVLPFKCRMMGDATAADVELVDVPEQPAERKCEVVLPVGMPEKGYFDWVDDFISRNPGYIELSDRKILEWASKSGIWRQKSGTPGSNDKPDLKFGIPFMDDNSVRKAIASMAPALRRNYVLPELRGNLLAAERKKVLTRFASHDFKRRAIVLMGEPSSNFKDKVQQLVLADKKAKVAAERKKKAQEEERKRLLDERKRKAEEARKAREAAQKKKAGKAVVDEEKNEEDDEPKEEEPKDGKADEDVAVELSEEEKSMWFRKSALPDIDARTLSKSYANFTIPNATEEGLDDMLYEWADADTSAKELKDWVLQQKMTQRVEDLVPGEWFKTEWSKWQKQVQEWRKRQGEWKDPGKRKAYLAKKKEELKKKKEEEAKEAGADAPEEEEEAKPMEINAEDLDVSSVEDVSDIGSGEPLFAHFEYEDWTLLSVRFEFHLMVQAFKKDMNDEDRPSFSEAHAAFYYNKYFHKNLSLKNFNLENFDGLVELIQDTIKVAEDGTKFFQTLQEEDASFATFLKLAEDNRRDRQRRLDAGDETAKLKFNRPAPPARGPQKSQKDAPSAGQGRYGSSQGGGSWSRSDSGRHQGGGGGYRGGGAAYSSAPQKRPYQASSHSAYGSAPKYQRTGGGHHGGGGGYYRR